jgi:hypothetical protein
MISAVCTRALPFAFLLLSAAMPAAAQEKPGPQPYQAPQHTTGWPGLAEDEAALARGPELQRGGKLTAVGEHRSGRAPALKPQKKGKVDAYVVSVALDSDPVFGREAREAGKVLTARFGAAGHSITLAGTDGSGPTALPNGTLASLTLALARIAELMDPKEDVLVLYSTSHGAPVGIAYHDGDEGFGLLTPDRLAAILTELGIKRRVLLLSACYSGVFIPALAGEDSAILTAASNDRPSFGCMAENDWTFFGDALINHALRKPQPLAAAAKEAQDMIGGWEADAKLNPSNPQVSIGSGVAAWLPKLEAVMPKTASAPVGKPATEALKQ